MNKPESDNLLRITLTSLGEALIATDAEGRVTFLNPIAETLTGWTSAEASGKPLKTIFKIVNEQTRRPVKNPAARALQKKAVVGLANHTVLIARDGTERSISDSAAPMTDENGAVVGVVLVFRDVTEQRRAERQIQESEARYRTLIEVSPQTVWEGRTDGYITYCNHWWLNYTGMTMEQSEGNGWTQAIHPDHRERVLKVWLEAAARDGDYEVEIPFRRASDGAYRWHLVRGLSIRNEAGQVIKRMGIAIDIDERKRTEGAREGARARLQQLADSVPALISYIDAEGRYRLNNRTYEAWFGRSREEIYGKHLREVLGEAVWEAIRPHVETALSGRVATYESELPRRDGGTRWISATYTPDLGVDGAVRGFVVHANDISARKQAEEALREADRRKDEFLATLAHELRNPLAPLRTGLELLRMDGKDPSMITEIHNTMERQMQQMVRLVDDLLSISRITRGSIQLRRSGIELAAVVKDAVEAAHPLIEEAGHKLTVSLPTQPVFMEADPARLAQVFSNLLNNAAKYTIEPGQIWLTAERQDGHVIVTVKDTGMGIPAEWLPRIYEMFTQVSESSEPSHSGLGIGLTLVKRLVEMHGGTIEARSAGPGHGSEFIVRLPVIVMPGQQAQSPDAIEAAAHSNARRILVVDDNRDAAKTLGTMLKMLGNEIRTAFDGEQALATAAAFRPHVVLLDLRMPNLNGFDTARRMRAQPWGKDTVLIALSGWSQETDKHRTREAGFDHHLVKPVEPAVLQKILAELRPASA